MAIINPFQSAELTARKLKILLYGNWGTGKTYAALTFPRVALIDSEGGSTLYRGRPGIKPFSVIDTKSMTDLENAIAFIAADKGATFDTLVIDPVSVIYKITREAIAAANRKNPGDMGYREWDKLNARMNSLYTRLINLPVHVVMVARESTEYEGAGDSMRKVGVKPDSDKGIGYLFDIVLNMQEDYSGLVVKSRAAQFKRGDRIKTVNWSAFEPLVADMSTGKAETLTEDDAVSADEAVREQHRDEFQDREIVEAFVAEWKAQGAQISDIQAALQVKKLGQWTQGRDAAKKAMRKYMGLDQAAPTIAS
jgi:hypothetical protein